MTRSRLPSRASASGSSIPRAASPNTIRLEKLGVRSLSRHGVLVPSLTTPLRFVCAMGLTFENANLDHCADYGAAARAAGDPRTAELLDRVAADEVEHVRFGVRWLEAWREEGRSQLETYARNVTWPLRAALARGRTFHAGPRERAGLDPEFIRALSEADRSAGPEA